MPENPQYQTLTPVVVIATPPKGLPTSQAPAPSIIQSSPTSNTQLNQPKSVQDYFSPEAEAKRTKETKKLLRKIREKNGGTTAEGLNKLTALFVGYVKTADKYFDRAVYGNPEAGDSTKFKPLDYGILPLINLLASIDFCALASYAISQIPGGKKFNPNDKSQQKTTLGRRKWQLQYAAYKIQRYIDDFYGGAEQVTNPKNPDNVSKLQKTIIKIVEEINQITTESDNLFSDQTLNDTFPQLSTYSNYINVATSFFNQYTDPRNLPNEDIQKILKYIDKTKAICILIQGLETPANLISLADTILGGALAETIKKLNKIIDPKKIESVVKDIQKGVSKLNKVVQQILQVISKARSIVQIVTTIVKVLKIIISFLITLGLPSVFSTVGIHMTVAEAKDMLKAAVKYIMDRIKEINTILSAISYFFAKRSLQLGEIINGLQAIIINLQNCDSITPEDKANPQENSIISNLNQSITELVKSKTDMDSFVENYETNKTKRIRRSGEYTIEILKEEIVDEGISLRRRYGVALDVNQVVVAKSTPTFATNDIVIIEEVKLLLPKTKKTGLANVQNMISALSPDEFTILEEAANYLNTEDEPVDISIEIDKNEDAEDPDSEDDDTETGLGLQSFINKLKGGKKLRRRMHREMAKSKRKLADDMKKANPNAPSTKKTELEASKAELTTIKDNLKTTKEKLTKTIALAATNPLAAGIYVPLIRLLKKQIKELENAITQKIKDIKKIDPGFIP
jgi:hypothetical protein